MSTFLLSVLGFIFALAVSGLGNGVWEWVEKPLLKWLTAHSTAWMKRRSDSLYRFIATRPIYEAEKATLHAFFLVGVVLFSVVLVLSRFGDFVPANYFGPDVQGTIEKIRKESSTVEEAKSRVSAYNRELHTWSSILYAAATTLLLVSFARKHLVMDVVYRRIQEFDHLLATVRPSLTDDEFHRINQEFALMKSEQDYDHLLKSIKKRAEMQTSESEAQYLGGKRPNGHIPAEPQSHEAVDEKTVAKAEA